MDTMDHQNVQNMKLFIVCTVQCSKEKKKVNDKLLARGGGKCAVPSCLHTKISGPSGNRRVNLFNKINQELENGEDIDDIREDIALLCPYHNRLMDEAN